MLTGVKKKSNDRDTGDDGYCKRNFAFIEHYKYVFENQQTVTNGPQLISL